MLRSMFTAIGGLRNHQVMLDVTANNIANVNTVGYKAQRVDLRVDDGPDPARRRGALAARHRRHGPTQVGLGMAAQLHRARADAGLAADDRPVVGHRRSHGEGYFIVAQAVTTGRRPAAAPDIEFTRAGNFTVDKTATS